MTDKNIKRFSFDVWVKDSGTFANRYDAHLKLFAEGLRSKGYIPVLDIEPVTKVLYDQAKEVFHYTITIQTIYVGRKKASVSYGIHYNKILPAMRPVKSKPSSEKSE